MTTITELGEGRRDPGVVTEASQDSFPASDAPAYTPTTGLGAPPETPPVCVEDLPVPPLKEVHEHPVSDPDRQNEAIDPDTDNKARTGTLQGAAKEAGHRQSAKDASVPGH